MRRTLVFLLVFAETLACSARDTTEHWLEVRSQHFVVLTDTSEKQARRVAGQFERMRAMFHLLMPNASGSAGSPVIVLALKDKKALQSLEPAAYLAKGQLDLAGWFMPAPDKNYILLRLDAQGDHPYATIYHEYTHFMMRSASSWIPLWMSEGLAEFYQNTDIQEKEVLMGQASAGDLLYLRQNRLLPLTTLLSVDRTSPYYHEEQKGSIFYAESWALTHYLEIGDAQKGTTRLQDYANLLVRNTDPMLAAQQAFGDLALLQKSLFSYISQDRFMMFKMNKTVTVDESAFQARAIPETDADAIRADVLVYNERPKDAQVLLDSVLRDDPNNALAHETMGYLKFREGDIPGARKWYGEAVKLNSQSYLANYYYAAMSMGPGGENHDPAIESSLRTSIRLNPAFAPAYDALARYYMRDQAKTAEAHLLNNQAIALEPGNVNYRLNAAAVLVNGQQYENAVAVLKTAVRVAKTPEEIASVQTRLGEIEQYQAAMAKRQQAEKEAGAAGTTTAVTDVRPMIFHREDTGKVATYPTEAPTGKRHSARGTLRGVRCSYPMILTLSVDPSGRGPAVFLYRNDFMQIEFRALNFTPEGDLNPCKDIEGLKATVEYAEVSDKSVAGQIISVELSK
jgi:tetratricopeptide (TPR) repeat protein